MICDIMICDTLLFYIGFSLYIYVPYKVLIKNIVFVEVLVMLLDLSGAIKRRMTL